MKGALGTNRCGGPLAAARDLAGCRFGLRLAAEGGQHAGLGANGGVKVQGAVGGLVTGLVADLEQDGRPGSRPGTRGR
jgi:hypothetical protein